jgi:hypothetical protein
MKTEPNKPDSQQKLKPYQKVKKILRVIGYVFELLAIFR